MRNSRPSIDYQRKRQCIGRRLSSDDVHGRGQRRRLRLGRGWWRRLGCDQRLGCSKLVRLVGLR
jgi:hypothetical protein